MNLNTMSIRFGCTIEASLIWVNAATLLYYSLKENGGEWANDLFLMLVAVDEPSVESEYTNDNLTVRLCQRHSMPYLNKVSQLKMEATEHISHIFILDSDTIIRRLDNFGEFVTKLVRARRNNKDTLADYLGQNYEQPLEDLAHKPWSEVPYFNSGVVLVPIEYCAELAQYWISCTNVLFPIYQNSLAEQIGFAVGLARSHLPWDEFPRAYNHTNWGTLLSNASILHYNDYDRENRKVKREIMTSFSKFERFVDTTNNRFWEFFKPDIQHLLALSPEYLAKDIWDWLQSILNLKKE